MVSDMGRKKKIEKSETVETVVEEVETVVEEVEAVVEESKPKKKIDLSKIKIRHHRRLL